MILAHGAGAPMDHPALTAIAHGVAEHGVRVVRFEFPYMRKARETGKRGRPDREAVLLESWRAVIAEFGPPAPLVIGGRSMGGRMASMIADEAGVAGLVCMGYPFHPPGRPERLRTAHLAALRTPTLILQGERDTFGTRADVDQYELSAAIQLQWLPDGDHSLKPRKRSGFSEADHLRTVADSIVEFAAGLG